MPVHDWTLVEAEIFHDFHTTWIGAIRTALNDGRLPGGYYVLAEQHFGKPIADVLAFHESEMPRTRPLPPAPDTGGVAIAEAPPKTRQKLVIDPEIAARRRSLAIRHVSDHRLVALLEIVSPSNKDRRSHVADFVHKAVEALKDRIHLLVIDLFPPGPFDAEGMCGAIVRQLDDREESFAAPIDEQLTLASFAAGERTEIYIEHHRVGAELMEMPLFLRPDRYINVPLEETYRATYRGMPAYWRAVLEGRNPEVSPRGE